MTLLVYQLVQQFLPVKRRQNPKGWIIFNSPCCHHRGHSPDTRSRGNAMFSSDGGIVFNCYNCNFKTGFKNNSISGSFESWLTWLGVPRDQIQKAKLDILNQQLNGNINELEKNTNELFFSANFDEIDLPDGAESIVDLAVKDTKDPDFLKGISYLNSRGRAISENWEYYWSQSKKNDMNKRIIIPFKYNNKIVGWTARYTDRPPKGVSRYFNSDKPPAYLFNADVLNLSKRKFVIITEGPFDAIAVDGIAVLGSSLNKYQISWLNSSDKEKIVLPDRESKNQDLIDCAIDQKWSVSFPEWDVKIKDAADASKYYGRLYTIFSTIKSKTNNQLEIQIKRQMLKG